MASHPDLPAEQAYLDHAHDCLERMRERIARVLDAGSNEFSAEALDAWQVRTLRSYEDAERGICFGRLDMDDGGPLYVGRRWIHDERAAARRRQLAGARGASFLHGHARRAAARRAPPPLPHRGSPPARDRRRDVRRHGRRRAALARRLPARGARAQPRRAHARHRRHDPGRPVPADHARRRGRARRPGRAGDGQDRGRPPPRFLAPVHARAAAAARGRARRRAEPHVHRVRLARAAVAGRGERRAASRRRSPRGDRRLGSRRARDGAGEGRRGDGRASPGGGREAPPRAGGRARGDARRELRARSARARPRAPRRGVGRGRELGRPSRTPADGPASRLLPGVRAQARRRGDEHLRGAGEGADEGRLPQGLRRPRSCRRSSPSASSCRRSGSRAGRASGPRPTSRSSTSSTS